MPTSAPGDRPLTPPTRARVSAALRRLSRPSGTFDVARYFRGDHGLRFYNVGAANVRALARAIHIAHRESWSIDDAMALADELLNDPFLETKAVGIDVVARFRREFHPRLLPRWKRWLARNLAANWATTDALCGMLIGPLLTSNADLLPQMLAWTRHRNLWVRRASAVALIPAIRRGLGVDEAYATAAALRADREDLIQKAVGWMLRDSGRQDPRRLEQYLRAAGPATPRTTLRYAIEHFPPAKRLDLLACTRA